MESATLLGVDLAWGTRNPAGRRPCEAQLNAVFARYDAGAHPCTTSRPELADPPLRVAESADWQRLRQAVETAARKSELRAAEDVVDAVLCAYIALFAACRPERTTVFGDAETGYIVVPAAD
ncbi:MAG TPA: DUF429 domain-containing protein [Nocardioidaceae bacterium]|nr:DUF429 domain-containing protein [Nocardioidaceae bacterium]